MVDWPAIQNPGFPMDEVLLKAQVRTEFEAGYVQSRARHTRTRRKWKLRWKAMTDADFATLATFFATNQGGSFAWTHPATAAEYTVRFSDDEISGDPVMHNRRKVEVSIEEV